MAICMNSSLFKDNVHACTTQTTHLWAQPSLGEVLSFTFFCSISLLHVGGTRCPSTHTGPYKFSCFSLRSSASCVSSVAQLHYPSNVNHLVVLFFFVVPAKSARTKQPATRMGFLASASLEGRATAAVCNFIEEPGYGTIMDFLFVEKNLHCHSRE